MLDGFIRSRVMVLFIRLRQNTLRLAAGMNGEVNPPKLGERRRVGYGGIPLDTPPLAVGSFICRFNRNGSG